MAIKILFILLTIISWLNYASCTDCDASSRFNSSREQWPATKLFNRLKIIADAKRLFENKSFMVSMRTREPFVRLKHKQAQKTTTGASFKHKKFYNIDQLDGIAIRIFASFMKILNFNATFYETADRQFGSRLQNGSWTGIVGDVLRNEAEFGLSALSVTFERAKHVDFTRAFFVDSAAILLPTPGEVQNLLAIFTPFTLDAWCVLLTLIGALIALVAYMTKLERDLHVKPKLGAPSATLTSLGASVQLRNTAKASISVHNYSQIFNRQQFYYGVACVLAILLLRGKNNSFQLVTQCHVL